MHALSSYRQAVTLTFTLYSLPHNNQIEALSEMSKTFIELAAYDSAEHYLTLAEYIFTTIPQRNKKHYDTSFFKLIGSYINIRALQSSLYHKKGQVRKSIEIFEELIPLIKSTYPDSFKSNQQYQIAVSNLANYYSEVYALKKAKYYAHEYLRLIDKANKPIDKIHAYQNLGTIYRNYDSDSALYYWQKALEVIEKNELNKTKVHCIILNNIGEWDIANERYEGAIEVLQQSLDLQLSLQAINPPLHQTTLFNLAEAHRALENYKEAHEVYKPLIDDLLEDIAHNFTYLSDNEKMAFYNNQVEIIDSYKSFCLEISGLLAIQSSDDPYIDLGITGELYDLQLNTKAIILNASKRIRSDILNSGDSSLIHIYSLWEERKNQYARLLLQEDLPENELNALSQKIEENEKWLTTNSRKFKSGFVQDNVNWKDVQRKLKTGEAAIEMIQFLDGLIYGALIITPETKDHPELALLMSTRSKHLNNEFYNQYRNSITYQLLDTISYQTYWEPIAKKLKALDPNENLPKRIYFSNEGIYNKLNLNTLYDGHEYLIDQTEIITLTNTKELLHHQKSEVTKKRALLLGRPAFSSYDHGMDTFIDLPGTGEEVKNISLQLSDSKWDVAVFTDKEATEETLKAIQDIEVLHLATHGYFYEDLENQTTIAAKMINSGVALAGVNDPIKKHEDGLLTSFEIMNLDLDSTQLVVLSACETGLGSAGNGDGVYGLQRALLVAGAQNMIMSLWKVDDAATKKLMSSFYKEWTSSKDLHQAFRNAQLSLRKEYPTPYYWGAFILAGQ